MSDMKTHNKQAVQNFFTRGASQYSNLFLDQHSGSNYNFQRRLSMVMELASSSHGNLLDCACGSGEITAALSATKRYEKVTAVDLSSKMLGLTREKVNADCVKGSDFMAEYVNADIFNYLGKSIAGQYDLILCLGLIAHTGRLIELLSSMKRVVADDGVILLQSTLLDHPFTRIVRGLSSRRYSRIHGYNISYFTEREIIDSCEKVGLKVQVIKKYGFGLPFGDSLWSAGNYRLEKKTGNWSAKHGTEALFVLGLA